MQSAGESATSARPIDLLWTSGWDSTFRLLAALYLEDVTIRPHYIADRARRSTDIELRTMDQIRVALAAARPGSERRVLPLKLVELSAIPPDPATATQFESLAARGPIGSQYEWIARYAIAEGLHELELSIHHDDRAKLYLEGKVERVGAEPFPSYRLAAAHRGTDLALFERFRFPIFDLSKLDMREIARQHGFLDILELAWFCHKPLASGAPCGVCNPCKDAVKEGVGYRLPRGARVRQALHAVVPYTKILSKLQDLTGRNQRS